MVGIGFESCMCGCPFKDDAVACSDEEVISWAQGCCISNLAAGRSEVTICTRLFPGGTRVKRRWPVRALSGICDIWLPFNFAVWGCFGIF